MESKEEAPPVQMPPVEEPPKIEDVVTPNVIKKIVSDYDDSYEAISHTAVPGTEIGDNYMSIMYAVDIQIKKKGSDDEPKTLAIMLKTMPRNEMRIQMINDCLAFVKEQAMYDEVFRDFVNFQKSKGISGDEIYQGWPKCYSTYSDQKTDYLAMQNLRPDGYKMVNRAVGLDFNHGRVVMKELAKFHAVSYAMYGGDFDAIMKKYPYLLEKMFDNPEVIDPKKELWIKGSFEMLAGALENAGHGTEAETVRGLGKPAIWPTMASLVAQNVPKSVVTHGDCWTNNLLFRYDEENNIVGQKFIDFQITRTTSRTIDLNYFMHTSLQIPVLNDREEELLKIYYDQFNQELDRLDGHKLEESFEDFMAEYNRNRMFGVLMGCMLAPILAAAKEDAIDMENIDPDIFEKTDKNPMEGFENMYKGGKLVVKVLNILHKQLPLCTLTF